MLISEHYSLSFLAFTYQMSSVEELLTVREACLYLRVREQSVWRWIKKGKIKSVKLPSGRYRIPKSEIVKIMQVRL